MSIDLKSMDYLQKIVSMHSSELTDFHVAFLRARASYLTPEQREQFKEFLTIETKLSMPELLKQAKELGLSPKFGIKRDELEKLIATVQTNT